MRPCLCLLLPFSMLLVSGCGNKGDLYLPVDEQLADELNTASELIDESTQNTDVPNDEDELGEQEKADKEASKRRIESDAESDSAGSSNPQ